MKGWPPAFMEWGEALCSVACPTGAPITTGMRHPDRRHHPHHRAHPAAEGAAGLLICLRSSPWARSSGDLIRIRFRRGACGSEPETATLGSRNCRDAGHTPCGGPRCGRAHPAGMRRGRCRRDHFDLLSGRQIASLACGISACRASNSPLQPRGLAPRLRRQCGQRHAVRVSIHAPSLQRTVDPSRQMPEPLVTVASPTLQSRGARVGALGCAHSTPHTRCPSFATGCPRSGTACRTGRSPRRPGMSDRERNKRARRVAANTTAAES